MKSRILQLALSTLGLSILGCGWSDGFVDVGGALLAPSGTRYASPGRLLLEGEFTSVQLADFEGATIISATRRDDDGHRKVFFSTTTTKEPCVIPETIEETLSFRWIYLSGQQYYATLRAGDGGKNQLRFYHLDCSLVHEQAVEAEDLLVSRAYEGMLVYEKSKARVLSVKPEEQKSEVIAENVSGLWQWGLSVFIQTDETLLVRHISDDEIPVDEELPLRANLVLPVGNKAAISTESALYYYRAGQELFEVEDHGVCEVKTDGSTISYLDDCESRKLKLFVTSSAQLPATEDDFEFAWIDGIEGSLGTDLFNLRTDLVGHGVFAAIARSSTDSGPYGELYVANITDFEDLDPSEDFARLSPKFESFGDQFRARGSALFRAAEAWRPGEQSPSEDLYGFSFDSEGQISADPVLSSIPVSHDWSPWGYGTLESGKPVFAFVDHSYFGLAPQLYDVLSDAHPQVALYDPIGRLALYVQGDEPGLYLNEPESGWQNDAEQSLYEPYIWKGPVDSLNQQPQKLQPALNPNAIVYIDSQGRLGAHLIDAEVDQLIDESVVDFELMDWEYAAGMLYIKNGEQAGVYATSVK